jgi:hypothetical protein
MNTFDLSKTQIEKLHRAKTNGTGCSLEFSNQQLRGTQNLPLTTTQVNKVLKAKQSNKGLRLSLSKSQIKKGGLLPLATLLPLISGGIGAVSGAIDLTRKIKGMLFPKKKPSGRGLATALLHPSVRKWLAATTTPSIKSKGKGIYLGPPSSREPQLPRMLGRGLALKKKLRRNRRRSRL